MPRLDFTKFSSFLEYEKRYSKHTLVAYESDLIQFTDYLFINYEIDDIAFIKPALIRSWLVQLVQEKIEPRTINRKISTLKSFFKFYLKEGSIATNPMLKIQSPKTSKRLPVFIDEKNTSAFLDLNQISEDFSQVRNNTIFMLFYATGMRRSELINLKDQDIDFRKKQLKVLGKGNKERVIPLEEEMVNAIQKYIEKRNKNNFERKEDYLFVTNTGKKMYPEMVYKLVKRIINQVSTIEKKSPHVLRHTFATHLLNSGAEINAIKEILGHSSLAATQVYTHNSIEKLKEVYQTAHPKAKK